MKRSKAAMTRKGSGRALSPSEQELAREHREALIEKLIRRGCDGPLLRVLVDRVSLAQKLDRLAKEDRGPLKGFIKRIRRIADEMEQWTEVGILRPATTPDGLRFYARYLEEVVQSQWYTRKWKGGGKVRPVKRVTEEAFFLFSYVKVKTGQFYLEDVAELVDAASGDALKQRYHEYRVVNEEQRRLDPGIADPLDAKTWARLGPQILRHPDFFEADPVALSRRKSS